MYVPSLWVPTQRSHGKTRPQAPRPDELLAGVPASAGPPITRDALGRVQQGTSGAQALASLGGRAKAEAARLKRMLGLAEPAEPYRAYLAHAADWRDAQLRHLAEQVGGGYLGPDVIAIVSTAARQLAASLAMNDAAYVDGCEDPAPLLEKASKLGNDSRQNLLAAHELCARAAKARPLNHATPSWLQPADPK